MLLLLWCRLNKYLFPDFVKLIRYSASAVNVVPYNPCVVPLPRIISRYVFVYYQNVQMNS